MKLILHAGTHKTGTTAIQTFAVNNVEMLKNLGLIYPDYKPFNFKLKDGHHSFGHAFSDAPDKKMTRLEAKSIVREWQRLANNYSMPILVSVEALYRHVVGGGDWKNKRFAYLERVADAVKEFEVEVVLVFRRPDSFAKSLYIEKITTGVQSLESFGEWHRSSDRHIFNYAESVSLFEKVVRNVRILIYEDLAKNGNLVSEFFHRIGFKVASSDGEEVVRKSLTPLEAAIKNYANTFNITRKTGRSFVSSIKSPKFQREIAACFGDKEYDVWSSSLEQTEFLNSRGPDLKELSTKYFGGREIFDCEIAARVIEPVPEIPEYLKLMITEELRNISKSFDA